MTIRMTMRMDFMPVTVTGVECMIMRAVESMTILVKSMTIDQSMIINTKPSIRSMINHLFTVMESTIPLFNPTRFPAATKPS